MQSKWIGKSLTVWGGLVMALPGVFAALDWDIDTAGLEVAGIAVIEGISVVVGFVMVVIGRFRANEGAPVMWKPTI